MYFMLKGDILTMTNEEMKQRVIEACNNNASFIILEDGMTYYWPKTQDGAISAQQLRWIAEELDIRNSMVNDGL